MAYQFYVPLKTIEAKKNWYSGPHESHCKPNVDAANEMIDDPITYISYRLSLRVSEALCLGFQALQLRRVLTSGDAIAEYWCYGCGIPRVNISRNRLHLVMDKQI